MKTKTITFEQALNRHNDGQNQDIKGQFVGQHVFCNVNSLVEYCLSKGYEDSDSPVNLDEIENYYSINTENFIYEVLRDFDSKAKEFKAYANDPDTHNRRVKTKGDFEVFLNSLDNDELQEFAEAFEYEFPEPEGKEIFEWWAVSNYLFDKLKEYGCAVVDTGSCKVWGRTTTGQAILLDYVIGSICAEMEILEGQANSWAKKK